MAGSRPLTDSERKKLIRHIRRRKARNRALISSQLYLGFRISEVLALTIGHVLHNGQIRQSVQLPPRFLKGHYGHTRCVPISTELRRALERFLRIRGSRDPLQPADPLFPSPTPQPDGSRKPLRRTTAEKIIKAALRRVCGNPQGLSSHSLRKTWAQLLYRQSNYNILLVRDGLGHSSSVITERYLSTSRPELEAAILAMDPAHKNPRGTREAVVSTKSSAAKPPVSATR